MLTYTAHIYSFSLSLSLQREKERERDLYYERQCPTRDEKFQHFPNSALATFRLPRFIPFGRVIGLRIRKFYADIK